MLASLIAHELCHDTNSATDNTHSPEFYRAFHDLHSSAVPRAVGSVYRALANGKLLKLLGRGADVEPTEPLLAAARAAPAAPAAPAPAGGKVLVNRDRGGNERCRCTLRDDGQVEYAGKVYKSLSAAGLQATRDLGFKSTTCDGPTFWGVKKRA